MRHLFNSSALGAVDAAGNVVLPPFVRATLARRSDCSALMIGRHESDPCLRAYDPGYASILHTEHERCRLAEGGSDAHHARARRTFGLVEEAAYAPNGRISLPPMMRRLGQIEELALFVGTGGTFEIWNPQIALESGETILSELAAWRLEEFLPPTH